MKAIAVANALAAVALLVAAVPAVAQPYGATPGHSFEITPYAAYRFGGELDDVDFDDDFFDLFDVEADDGGALGVVFDARLGQGGWFLELWASRQETELTENAGFFVPPASLFDLTVDYYHAGFLYEWRPGQVHPFFAGSIGATRFQPEQDGLDDLLRPSFSLGGGVKVMFADNVGLRLEGRLITTLIDQDDDDFCDRRRRDGCFDFDDDIYFYQGEARVGLVLGF